MAGVQQNIVYDVFRDALEPRFQVCTGVRPNPGHSVLVPQQKLATPMVNRREPVPVGQEYALQMGTFHETPNTGNVMTLVRRGETDSERQPRVFRPLG